MTIIRPARPEDADELARWFNDAAALELWGGPHPRFPLDRLQMAGWLSESGRDPPLRSCRTLVDADGSVVGHFQLVFDRAAETVRIGRVGIRPDCRAHGIGERMVRAAVDESFALSFAYRVELVVAEWNSVALRLYRRIGFTEEGTLRGMARTADGRRASLILMSILRPEWPAGQTVAAGS